MSYVTKKRYVLITGCSTGIGLSLAQSLSTFGFHVIASTRKSRDTQRLKRLGVQCIPLDLESPESIASAIDQLTDITNGTLYALINNGAYGQPGAVEDLSRHALKAQFETNVFGTQELTNHCIPLFRRQGYGRIIQISSILGRVCLANRGAYNASKYALEALSDTMRLELEGSGIFVSLIEPGPIESDFRKNCLKHFQANINALNSAHSETYSRELKRLDTTENTKFTLPASSLLKPVLHALDSPYPKPRYTVTTPAKVLPWLKRITSDRFMDKILKKAGG